MLYSNFKKTSRLLLSLMVVTFLTIAGCSDTGLQSTQQNETVSPQSSSPSMVNTPSPDGKSAAADRAQASKTIVEIAASNDNFSILVKAVKFADLVEELNGKRQFTVFAPTNAAFKDLLDRLGLTADELFTEQNKDLVKSILLYHVVPGSRSSNVVLQSERINTLQKEFLMVKTMNGPKVGNDTNGYANITATDLFASNGVIHVVDQVLLQPSYNS